MSALTRHSGRCSAAVVALAVTSCGVGVTAAPAVPLGVLDAAFSGDGLVALPAGTQLRGSAVQRDGKLVVTGLIRGPDTPRLLVARLTRAGNLDQRFGSKGLVTGPLPSGARGAIGEAVTIQRDGRIVVAGDVRGDSGADGMLVTRLNANGTIDRRFGNAGSVALERGINGQGEANAVALRANGTIVVAGAAIGRVPNVATAAVAQLRSTGKRAGKTRYLDIGEATIEGIVVRASGKIAFAGSRKPGQAISTILGQLNANGTRDTRFASRGVRETSYARNGAAASVFRAIALQADGKLVATGYAFNGTGPAVDKITVRVTATGRADASFGPGGVRYRAAAADQTVNSQLPAGGAGVAIDGGRIYTGGSRDEFGSSAFAIEAVNSGGAAQSAFGTGGETITPIANYAAPAYGASLALGSDGVYVVGTAGNPESPGSSGIIARYGAYRLKARKAQQRQAGTR